MPALTAPFVPYTQDEIDGWNLRSYDIRTGKHPTERRQIGNNVREETWFCNWDAREDVIRYFLGDSGYWNDGGTLKITRLLPRRHPTRPEMAAVRLDSMTGFGRGIDDEDGNPQYETAELHFSYEHVPFDLLDDDDAGLGSEFDRYTWFEPGQGTADALTVPGGVLHYILDGGTTASGIGIPDPHLRPIPYNISKVFPITRFRLSLHRWPYPCFGPSTAIWDRLHGLGEGDDSVPWVGCINRERFLDMPTGTVLLESFDPHTDRSPLGTGREWRIDFNFAFKPSGWCWLPYYPTGTSDPAALNLYFVGKGDQFYLSPDLPDNYSLYNARDFNGLLDLNPS